MQILISDCVVGYETKISFLWQSCTKRSREREKVEDERRGKRTLCTSLIQHCRDMGFISSLRAMVDTMTRRVNKRRVLFSKCAPGNRTSCCSCVELLSLVCHFNQEPPGRKFCTRYSREQIPSFPEKLASVEARANFYSENLIHANSKVRIFKLKTIRALAKFGRDILSRTDVIAPAAISIHHRTKSDILHCQNKKSHKNMDKGEICCASEGMPLEAFASKSWGSVFNGNAGQGLFSRSRGSRCSRMQIAD